MEQQELKEQYKNVLKQMLDEGYSVEEMAEQLAENEIDHYYSAKTKNTLEEHLDEIAERTVDDIDIDHVYDVMFNMGWEYGLPNGKLHVVSKEEIIDMAKYVVKEAVKNMLKSKKDDYGFTACGGFECEAFVDDDGIVDVNLKFVPNYGYFNYDFQKLKKYIQQDNG